MVSKKDLSERDICTQFILPALINAGWDVEKQINESQLPPDIKMERSLAIKTGKNHKIKTDTGIEIIFPAEYFENHDYIEFINNPNGTISIELKNIGKILNK